MSFTLAIHGGAGTIAADDVTPDRAAAYHDGLRAALLAGWRVLAGGGAALDAVVAAVSALEDDPLFNAGRGAVFTRAGQQEMDAAVMDGATGRAGAVGGIRGPRNPIRAARCVLERTPHVLLTGAGAMDFLRAQPDLAFEPDDYFHTDRRWAALQRVLAAGAARTDAERHGTVGAVALDGAGRLAAATSTGGQTGKLPGRIGDTPLVGAGTWASATCAVSATGDGDVFIRVNAAHEVDARMRYLSEPVDQAAGWAVEAVGAAGGTGGVIAVDGHGRIAMPFNTAGMYRGWAGPDGRGGTAIHREAEQPVRL